MSSSAEPSSAELLQDALAVVQQQTVLMRRNLETPGKLMDALKCSSTLVSELRTSSLSPKQYYELYMAVFDALRHLAAYLRESHPRNHLADLYELVQYAGNIIPRLYLMITVGTVYMGIEDAPVKEIMKDMMEMSRGVQQPMRGLFLRYYLSGQSRDHLPTGNSDGPEGNLQDSISFVLTNFVEMNKLWVRLQHQGHSREREKRTQERKELQLLVGSNIVRLSQLVDLDTYKNVILAPLLEQVVQCRDVLAQEYLLEVITQVFPDEFHLHTLDQFLAATARLNPSVNIKAIVIGMMDRLSSYATKDAAATPAEERLKREEEAAQKLLERLSISKEQGDEANKESEEQPDAPGSPTAAVAESVADSEATTAVDSQATEPAPAEAAEVAEPKEEKKPEEEVKGIPDSIKLYEIFFDQVLNLIAAQNLPIQDIMALLVSLSKLALNIYPDRLQYIDQILDFAAKKVNEIPNSPDLHAPPTQQNILSLLLAPVTSYLSLFTVLALPHYIPLLQIQTYATRRAVAGEVIKSLLKNQTKIRTLEHCEGVLELVRVLIREGSQQVGYPGGAAGGARRTGPVETDETIEEQGQLARLVHLLHSPVNDTQFKLLQTTRKAFADGGDRVRYTSPAIITQCVKLARRYKKREHFEDGVQQMSTALYKFMHQTISNLNSRVGAADLCLRLYVFCGQVADQCGFEEISYEFFAQAFTIYEESISDSRAQFQAVCIIGGALHATRSFSKENYDTLITKCALHSSKLLKKPDQCRAVYLASHLWWATEIAARNEDENSPLYRDGKRVLECLQRALRVADACMDTAVSIELFVEILNRYVYYYDRQNEAVAVKYINGLIELIHSNLASNPESTANEAPKKHFERTIAYIRSRGFEDVVVDKA